MATWKKLALVMVVTLMGFTSVALADENQEPDCDMLETSLTRALQEPTGSGSGSSSNEAPILLGVGSANN